MDVNNGKDWAAVFIASVIVIAYIGIGFVVALAQALLGVDMKFPPDWSSAMLSLVSTAFGFLIAKVRQGDTAGAQSPVVENAESVNVAAPVPPVATRRPEIKP